METSRVLGGLFSSKSARAIFFMAYFTRKHLQGCL